MKEIITKRMAEIEERKYVADDGKEFKRRYDCYVYERQKYTANTKMDYKRLVVCKFNIPYTDWNSDTLEIEVVNLNTEKDYCTVFKYHTLERYDCKFDRPKEYPCTKVVVSDENFASFSCWSVGEVMNRLAKAYDDAARQLIANNVNFKEDM